MAQVKLNRHLDVVLDGVLNLSVASSSATNSIHTKTQEGETTLQHAEIVAGFLRKVFYPIFIIALMTVFTSCRDDENNISPIGEIKTMGESIDPSNSNNPYDNYGEFHNNALDYGVNNLTYVGADKDSIESELFGLIVDYCIENDPDSVCSNYTRMEAIDSIVSALEHIDNIKTSASIQYTNWANNLMNIITSSGSSDYNFNIETVIDNVKLWEDSLQTFVNNTPYALSDNEVKQLLVSASVARYSSVYWKNIYVSGGGIWGLLYSSKQKQSNQLQGFFSALADVVSDAIDWIGDNIGSIAITAANDVGGAIWGTQFGPVGSIVSSVACSGITALGMPWK